MAVIDKGLLSAAILAAVSLVAVLALRRLPKRIRISFDLACFVGITSYLIKNGISPFISTPGDLLSTDVLSLRVLSCAWWLLAARVLIAGFDVLLQRDRESRAARLTSDVTAAIVYIVAVLVILKSVLALPVSGVLATSGLLAVVLGLALQNTLGDVFAGIAVGVEAPFKVGDRIALADRLEGQVVQVNWRSVWIQTDDEDVAIIPNSLVAKNQLINRSYPSQRRAVSVELSCPHTSAPEQVIETVLDATWLCLNILRDPPPQAALIRLGEKRHRYTIRFSVARARDLSDAQDKLLRQCRRQLYYGGLMLERLEHVPESTAISASAVRWTLIRDVALFHALTDESLLSLVTQLQSQELQAGETLFVEDAADSTLYVIGAGVMQLTRMRDTVREIIGSIGAGDYVGEMGLLTGAPHGATATALTRCVIYKLSRNAIAPLLTDNTEVAAAFERSVRQGLAILHRQVAMQANKPIGSKGQILSRIREFFRPH